MKKFVFNDAWTGPDKTKHAVLCGAAAVVLGVTFGIVPAAIAVTVVALGKEVVYDAYLEKGTPSLQDFVVSEAGMALGLVTANVLRAAS